MCCTRLFRARGGGIIACNRVCSAMESTMLRRGLMPLAPTIAEFHSKHPYDNNVDEWGIVHFPPAVMSVCNRIEITFDPRTRTEANRQAAPQRCATACNFNSSCACTALNLQQGFHSIFRLPKPITAVAKVFREVNATARASCLKEHLRVAHWLCSRHAMQGFKSIISWPFRPSSP